MLSLVRYGANLDSVDDEVVALIRGCLVSSNVTGGGGVVAGAEVAGASAGVAGPVSNNVPELPAQVTQLIQDKRELEIKLRKSRENMERLMTEYASMYSGSQKDAKAKLDRESAILREK